MNQLITPDTPARSLNTLRNATPDRVNSLPWLPSRFLAAVPDAGADLDVLGCYCEEYCNWRKIPWAPPPD